MKLKWWLLGALIFASGIELYLWNPFHGKKPGKTDLKTAGLNGPVRTVYEWEIRTDSVKRDSLPQHYSSFNRGGMRVGGRSYSRDGELEGIDSLKYNRMGMLGEQDLYDKRGRFYGCFIYSYDRLGNNTGMQRLMENEKPEYEVTRKFDDRGNCIEEVLTTSHPDPPIIKRFTFDDKNNNTSVRIYTGDSMTLEVDYKYDAGSHQTETMDFGPGRQLRFRKVYEYNSNGDCTAEKEYDNSGRINHYERSSFTYDSSGRRTSVLTYMPPDTAVTYSLRSFYDEHGNMIRAVGRERGVQWITSRKIEYY